MVSPAEMGLTNKDIDTINHLLKENAPGSSSPDSIKAGSGANKDLSLAELTRVFENLTRSKDEVGLNSQEGKNLGKDNHIAFETCMACANISDFQLPVFDKSVLGSLGNSLDNHILAAKIVPHILDEIQKAQPDSVNISGREDKEAKGKAEEWATLGMTAIKNSRLILNTIDRIDSSINAERASQTKLLNGLETQIRQLQTSTDQIDSAKKGKIVH